MTFYQVFDSGRACVLNLEERGLQNKREEAVVDLYHDVSNSQEPGMLFSCDCAFTQGYCMWAPRNSIVSKLRASRSLHSYVKDHRLAQLSSVPLLFLSCVMLF